MWLRHNWMPCLTCLPVSAVKTGMLFSRPIIDAVAKRLAKRRGLQLVIDPVMISSSGTPPLLKPSAEAALNKRLLPLAKLVTPNLDEAAALAGHPVCEPEEMRDAARAIHARFGCAVLVKGGHMKTTDAIDLFYDGKEEFLLSAPRVRRMSPPGTGCTYSAAITAFLAKGEPLVRAVKLAKQRWFRRSLGRIGPENRRFWANSPWPRGMFSATFPPIW